MPAAEEQGDTDGTGGHHSRVFGEEEEGESHRAVFGVVAADQFLLGFGHVERGAVGLGVDADEEHDERERLRPDVPRPDGMGLLIDDIFEIQRAEHDHHTEHGQSQRDFVADHVGGGAKPAEEGVFVVAGPPAQHDAVHRQGEHGQDEQHADVQAGGLEIIAIGDGDDFVLTPDAVGIQLIFD